MQIIVSHVWQRSIGRFLESPAMVVAEPDVLAPLNTGFMLVKPSEAIFEEGRDVVVPMATPHAEE